MKAEQLQEHLDAGKEAAETFEPMLAQTARDEIVRQGDAAADGFLAATEGMGDYWSPPYEDEVFNVEHQEALTQQRLDRVRDLALRAYTDRLPETLPKSALVAAGRRRTPPGEVRVNWNVTSPFIAPVFERTGEHIATITQTTRGKVMTAIRESYDQGLSVKDTAETIRATIRASSLGRAQTIARTEIARLINGAQLAATKVVSDVAQIGYYKRWLTAPGAEHPRHEEYEGLDGQTVELDALFDVGGEQLDYPGDPGGSPDETCNCRCSMEMVEAEQAVAASAHEEAVVEELHRRSLLPLTAEEDQEVKRLAGLLTAAGLPSQEPTLEEVVDTAETLADNPMQGQCANCGHSASNHAGDMNDGECGMDECSCQGMETSAKSDEAAVAPQMLLIHPGEAILATSAASNTSNVTFKNGWLNVTTMPETITADVALPTELQPSEEMPEEHVSPEAPESDLGTQAAYLRWAAILAPEGKATDDGRIFAPGSIGWRELPLSLMAMTETPGEGGHAGAELCGRIDSVYRDADVTPTLIRAEGVFNDDEIGSRIAGLVDDGFLTGNSVDLAVNGSKVVLRTDVVDEDGFWLADVDIAEVAEVNIEDVMFGLVPFESILFVITEAKIGMSTVCPFPAFAEASISLASDGSQRRWTTFQGILPGWQTVHMADSIRLVDKDALLTASAAGMVPVVPPSEWFEDPALDELTGLTVTDEGRVYGHAWQWDACHIGIQDACTVAPHSETGYAYFLLKEVETDDGQRIECGTITLDTNHAARHLSWRDAASHYDHTGTAIADVTFGEDEYGGWFSGALRPDASAEAVRKFRGATVSGDWRRIHGNLELVGLLTVNVPGFPVPRTRALVATAHEDSEVLTLIAAGIPDAPKPEDVTEIGKQELALLAAQAHGELDELSALAERARA